MITDSTVHVQAELTDEAEDLLNEIRPRLLQFIAEMQPTMPPDLEENEVVLLLIAGLAVEAQRLYDEGRRKH